jgi:hypothetical protein
MLEPGETVEITVEQVFKTEVSCSEIVIRIEPTVGLKLTLRVKVPEELTPVMELISEFSTPALTSLAPAPGLTSAEIDALEYEYDIIVAWVGAMMIENRLPSLPNPSALTRGNGTGGCDTGTNDMTAFPDGTSLAGSADKQTDPEGADYSSGDKYGYILFGHDLAADGGTASTVNYMAVATTSFCYQTTAVGTITQYDKGGDQCNPVRVAACG